MSRSRARKAAARPKVVLVGWSGADWRVIRPLLDAGELPHLEGVVRSGVMGSLATLHPQVSTLLSASISTGKLADKHGVLAGWITPAFRSSA